MREIRFHKAFMGIVGAEMTSTHTQIMGLLLPFTEQHKNGFPILEKLGKMKKNVREYPNFLTGEKQTLQTPKHRPLLPILPATQKTSSGNGEVKKMIEIVKERAQPSSCCMRGMKDVGE